MKKALLILVIILCSAQLYSAEPLVKFYLQDGSTKQYNLSDIDSLNVTDKKNNYVMRIHYQDTLIAYYPNEIIGSIKFEKDSTKHDILNVYIFSYPKSYILSSIDSVVFYIDKYQPLTIGSQVWMLKNLNADHYRNGDSIPEVGDKDVWKKLDSGAWCYYNNDSALGAIYGKLYNWYAVNDPRGLAPEGWHVASDEEWKALEIYLGMSQADADEEGNYRGTNEGGKLKEKGISHWRSPNTGATNESGFSALPCGWRLSQSGVFGDIGTFGGWWSASENTVTDAWTKGLSSGVANIGRYVDYKECGFSVRCIKDK